MMQSSNELPSAPVSVYLLAENRLLRETLARLLEKRGGLSIAGVSRYSESTLDEVFASGCAILLMDSMAIKQGMSLLGDLSERAPGIDARAVVLPAGRYRHREIAEADRAELKGGPVQVEVELLRDRNDLSGCGGSRLILEVDDVRQR